MLHAFQNALGMSRGFVFVAGAILSGLLFIMVTNIGGLKSAAQTYFYVVLAAIGLLALRRRFG